MQCEISVVWGLKDLVICQSLFALARSLWIFFRCSILYLQ